MWSEMSYNQFNLTFLERLETQPDSDEDVFADAEDTEYVGVKVAEDKPEAKQKEAPAKKPAAKKAAKQEDEDFGEESPF